MLKILINAYTCCPNMGSEPGVGWNFIIHLAKYCELYVISEGEYKEQCEVATTGLPIHWYWNPVPQSTRDKCWNQGNWSFYPLYAKWQKKTADIAREICKTEKIDILHQLNMIGFREPGYLADVSRETGIPLVWGPIGGLKQFPMAYASGIKMKAFNLLKNTITTWQIKHDKRVVKTLHQSGILISSIPDSYNAIKNYHGLESVIIPETGCFTNSNNENTNEPATRFLGNDLTILWVGKFDFRKRLDIAINAIAYTKNPNIHMKVFGTGSEAQITEAKTLISKLGIDKQISFMGSLPNDIVKAEMRKADAFLFTSVNEDTSTVVLEAVSNQLPVLCFDCCGMAAVVDETVGIKVPLTNPKQSAYDFAKELNTLYNDRENLITLSTGCITRAQELCWENKAKQMVHLYENVLHKK